MITRKLTSSLSLLGALLFAAVAHAGDYSMDVGRTAAEPGSSSSSSLGDCASAGSSTTAGGNGVSGVRDSTHSSASAATAQVPATAAGGADATPGGSSTSAEAIGVPIKARSNRWQSLVPGAIK